MKVESRPEESGTLLSKHVLINKFNYKDSPLLTTPHGKTVERGGRRFHESKVNLIEGKHKSGNPTCHEKRRI